MSNVIELEGVSKQYKGVAALRDLNLHVPRGEVLGLLGHNGAGKTTTIKIILGIIEQSAGRVDVLGHSPSGRDSRALRMQWGYLPESVSFYEQLSGREVLDYFARLKRVNAQQRDALLERVGLAAAADRKVKTYSKGMRQRLGLAQALLGQPKLLLLDEPTVGLDPVAVRDFFTTLDELRSKGTTIILSSHVLPGIEQHIDRVAILREGKLSAVGTLDELRRETGMPLQIRARGDWAAGAWESRFSENGIQGYQVNGHQIRVESPADQKLAVMRLLLDDSNTHDLDIQQASLETLYLHYMGTAGRIQNDA